MGQGTTLPSIIDLFMLTIESVDDQSVEHFCAHCSLCSPGSALTRSRLDETSRLFYRRT